MAELRSFIFLSRLQPQTMCYLGTWIRGSLPRSHVAAQIIEVAPGLDIEPLTDVAVKHADVRAGIVVVERQFGYLEIHGGTDEVQAAASAVLGALGATARDATRPEILASEIITMLDPQQAFLVNRNKIGSMALAGESLFVLEMRPASYAILAANEAEKAARIKLVDYRMVGATGRLYLSGTEADVRQAGRRRRSRPPEPGMSELEELRALVREVIRDVLPKVPAGHRNGEPFDRRGPGGVRETAPGPRPDRRGAPIGPETVQAGRGPRPSRPGQCRRPVPHGPGNQRRCAASSAAR